jgi:crotonobetainyl-CoA:carnitine CoA-transferase CaiB-like acyl-CoA transferase
LTDRHAPLHGFRILDFCDELAVYATRLLVNLGAEVIRPEPPGGDPMRGFPPVVDGVSLYFEHYNAGKRSVTLDLDAEEGVMWLGRLVATCNAVVESGYPEALPSARVGVERLRGFRPDLVLVSVTPFGSQGPHRRQRGGDLTIAAESGLLALNGRPDGTPYRPGGEQTAHMAGLLAANAALLGIVEQQRTGRGAHLDVPANFAAALATLQTANANFYTWHGRVPTRRGIGSPWFRLLHEAADGWVALQPLPGQWDNLVRLLADHDAARDLADARYQDDAFRMQNYAHVTEVVGDFTRRHPKRYLFEKAQAAGVACVPVNTPADILADPWLAERRFFREIRHARLGTVRYAGPPFHFRGQDAGVSSPAPAPGQDDEAIWTRELGMMKGAGARGQGSGAKRLALEQQERDP